MFIKFKTKEKKQIVLNAAHIVSIEAEDVAVVMGMSGGGKNLRIHATEGRVYQLETRLNSLEELLEQLKEQEHVEVLDNGKDQSSPV